MVEVMMLCVALKTHFGWNLARLKCLSQFVLAMLAVRTVNLSEIANVFKGKQTKNANYKRIQRFLAKFDFCMDAVAKFIVSVFPLGDTWVLSIDRTNWKFGKTEINVLMLSVCYRNVAIPLFWKLLGKAGNSHTDERTAILTRFISTFGANKIQCLLGDREFIGQGWIEFLIAHKISFVIRVKEGFNLLNKKGKKKIKNLFHDLARGQYRIIPNKMQVTGCFVYLVGERLLNGDLRIVMTDKNPELALKRYDSRIQIEYLFAGLKRRGFCFEETHLTHSDRIEKLIAVMAIAFSWSYRCGDFLDEKKPIKRKNHGRRLNSIFKYGYEYLRKLLANSGQRFSEFKLAVEVIVNGQAAHRQLKLEMNL